MAEIDKKKRFADSEVCKRLKIYGDFSLLLGSHKDAIEYYSRIETIFPICDNKDNKWLAGGLECLVAVQYLILKRKLNFSEERYSSEKRDSAFNKVSKSLKIYGLDLQKYNKAASCFIKYSHFFRKMNMGSYFIRMLSETMSVIVHPKTTIIYKISCADYASQFECFRTSAYLLFDVPALPYP